jgi:hypothetical protein
MYICINKRQFFFSKEDSLAQYLHMRNMLTYKKKNVMKVLFRLIKVILLTCLAPLVLLSLFFTILVVIPTLMFIDLFKYILTGKEGTLEIFILGRSKYKWFDFEKFIFGWLFWVSDLYNDKILKRFGCN